MKPLEIHVRNRVLFARVQEVNKSIGSSDYTLYDKNGVSIYIFRNSMSKWEHVYGNLADDVREACLDALILRFDKYCTDMFYYKGERQVVDVGFTQGADSWHVRVNRFHYGAIRMSSKTMDLEYLEHHKCEALTCERMEKYFRWIREGKIKGSK
ncbi:hypothetical protein [Sphingobacterium deserti]|uniref:Uncharacterized protein n=1 Tax=Sphingobacterium deserti TaxID=1229276 RepID=A0A0B8T1P3_9SPHI|nr:hypothetical protein [Sphingobacterium deserti]KGE14606.1 hypothetical protein DI53_1635 [Sphingobacterium deserti]